MGLVVCVCWAPGGGACGLCLLGTRGVGLVVCVHWVPGGGVCSSCPLGTSGCVTKYRILNLNLTTLEGFTTMVANEGLEKAEPMDPGPPGPTALHPLRRMRCELFQVKEHTYSFF